MRIKELKDRKEDKDQSTPRYRPREEKIKENVETGAKAKHG